ncbi:hypothetical protein TVAG_311210 [Trichomonas vaginalis G3]|uniref:receptor protein-tyrosine kinase n=1 Tax=Trichomonas vaginalis (strain ATCC PRA-98 / G3) TaxID=412133 RepID=A2FUQ3_TRIV3|nr:glycine-rich protein family [Trichomonas vaginalis G3]EAX91370.1 hypothetical protein TVAG_311210 [Trichomonas vaginalis G3]KAI5520084.1 glycine-rich protein family [Trichomonas vaginalis G3]|eukprot:XP_001304300.1 hypothetical protein [Trichomonas vaginalis G3]
MYLFLGGKGEDQLNYTYTTIPTKCGWNFGGNGGIDLFHDTGNSAPPDGGACGGGATDIRLRYYDINHANFNDYTLNKSIESRIIVAGSGGGGNSGDWHRYGELDGFAGGDITAVDNLPYTHGGTQISGILGIGMDGITSSENQGGTGGCGSGYRGGYQNFPDLKVDGIFHVGGTGGSSYISGHPGCVSPSASENTPIELRSIHGSGIMFTNTQMISGKDLMPSPFNNTFIRGNVGNGYCRITVLYISPVETCTLYQYFNFFINFEIFITFSG